MRKIFAILFLTIYLASATELSELLKIPVLVEHFIEHKRRSPEMSFIAFLELHYKNHPDDIDREKDHKLPFIAHADVLSFYFVYTPAFFFKIEDEPSISQRLNPLFFGDVFFNNYLFSAIWQPPRPSSLFLN